MKTIFRNFMTTLRRFKLASGLNILGLSVAFAAFVLILMQVRYEYSFDKFHRNADRIYRVEINMAEGNVPIVPRPFGETFGRMSAGVEDYTMVLPSFSETYVTVEKNGTKVGFMQQIQHVEASFTNIFTPEMIEGGSDALSDPGKALLPASLALRFFGSETGVMGKRMTINGKDCEVGGVYRDFPSNSQLKNVLYVPLRDEENRGDWGSCSFFMYVLLRPGADPAAVTTEWGRFDLTPKIDWAESTPSICITKLSDLYFDTRPFMAGSDSATEHGKRTTTDILLAIALLVIGIAAVNFVNFSTSLTPLRIKSINTQKVLGSPVSTLRAALICEAVGIALIAFGLALLWVYLLSDTGFNELISGGISFSVYKGIILLALGVALGVGLLAGLYPAFYTTSFPPALVLKGSFGMSPKGRKLRTALIGFQFVVSLGLIVAAMFLQLQNDFLRHVDTGMEQEQIAYMHLGGELRGSKAFEAQVKQSPLIEDVAYSEMPIGVGNVHPQWFKSVGDKPIGFVVEGVSWNFPQMMGIELVDGAYFNEGDSSKQFNVYLFNERAAKDYELTTQDRVIEWGSGEDAAMSEIRGFVKDFNYRSLHTDIEPMALLVKGRQFRGGERNLRIAYFKIIGDPYAAADHIKRTAAGIDPAYPVDLQFFDAAFNTLYQKDRRTTSLITVFSLLAVIISLVGVFGLVVFETQYRRKEIGVRKVLGATVAEILAMFNRSFVRLVIVCFVVAAPLAWYGVTKWLETFAYRTPIHWWVFALSLFIVLLITLITVTIQSWRAATANPVNSLKTE